MLCSLCLVMTCCFAMLCCSVTKSCPALCNCMDCSTSGFPALHHLLEFAHIYAHWISDAHLTISSSVAPFTSSLFPSIRLFSNESALHIKWSKCWSFSISPSSEYSRLISFKIDCFDLLAVQGTLKSLLQHHNLKTSILGCSVFFIFTWGHWCSETRWLKS